MPANLDEFNKSIEILQLYGERFNFIYLTVKTVLDNQLSELDKIFEHYPNTADPKLNGMFNDIYYYVNHLKSDLEQIIYMLDDGPTKERNNHERI